MRVLPWRWPFGTRATASADAVSPPPSRPNSESLSLAPGPRPLPRPAIRWVGSESNIAIRAFEWTTDIESVCLWQRDTYTLNFPSFQFTPEFALAFRHDLRRATLDEHHGLFVLDDGPSGGGTCGFLWLVICLNSWTNERYGYINNIYLLPEKRGQHLGEELLAHAENWFKNRRVSKLRLTVTASNSAACHLYERVGYHIERHEMEKDLY